MASDFYLKIDGVKGETTAKDMKEFMEVLSFSFGASNPNTIGSHGGGSSGGKVSISSFNIMKRTDSASPTLFQMCCSGDHAKSAEMHIKKASGKDGGQATFIKYAFEQVFIDSIQWSGSSGGDPYPSESLSFSFGKVTVSYYSQDDKGKIASASQDAMWNLVTNDAKA